MKHYKLLPILFISLLAVTLISCDNDNKDAIRLDKESISFDIFGTSIIVNLISNGEWDMQEVPEWISVTQNTERYHTELSFTATENKEDTRRKASIIFTCGKTTRTLEVEQLCVADMDPFISLSKPGEDLRFEKSGFEIGITANTPWEITNIPDWVTVSPTSGDKSARISIEVKENLTIERRRVELIFSCKSMQREFLIYQYGTRDVIQMPTLSIFSFTTASASIGEFGIETNRLFVNPSIKDKVYLGNLLSHNTQSSTHIPEFTGYTFNPITVSTSAAASGEVAKTYVPSLAEQQEFAKQIIANSPNKDKSFRDDTAEFVTYGFLHAIGIANLGVKLDEVVTGHSYREKEMQGKYGLVFSFKQVLFTLDMDLPEELVQEEITATDRKKGVSYVSSVNYGKVGLLVIESETDSKEVEIVIDKVLSNQPLSQEETDLIESTDICYVYFDDNHNTQTLKGKMDAIDAYKAAIANRTENIYPIEFQLTDYDGHSVNTISFSFNIF